ncbi:hypothetical protein [Nitrososphaera sp.]|uniref:hypothetical protein n=1 Tax=Nitrososphaera sp. TaxID=1971748 RepID=UPI00307E93BC
MESLGKVLGRSMTDLLVMDLEKQGIFLGKEGGSYRLEQLDEAFVRIFGPDGGKLLMDRVCSVLGGEEEEKRKKEKKKGGEGKTGDNHQE